MQLYLDQATSPALGTAINDATVALFLGKSEPAKVCQAITDAAADPVASASERHSTTRSSGPAPSRPARSTSAEPSGRMAMTALDARSAPASPGARRDG